MLVVPIPVVAVQADGPRQSIGVWCTVDGALSTVLGIWCMGYAQYMVHVTWCNMLHYRDIALAL